MRYEGINVGSFRTKILIERPVSVSDGGGNVIDRWEEGKTVFCFFDISRVKYTGNAEAAREGSYQARDLAYVTLRHCSALTAGCRIRRVREGDLWYVVGTPPTDGRYMKITVERRVRA